MKAIELSEVSALSAHIKPGCDEPLLLTDHGHVVATIVPGDKQDAESMLLSINPKFNAILERSRQRLETEGGLSSDEVRKRLGLPTKGPGRTKRSTRPRPRGRSAKRAAPRSGRGG
jgi:antitoxin (DNA-binding transcriptional repressor) of toxin-antitoxin stability system